MILVSKFHYPFNHNLLKASFVSNVLIFFHKTSTLVSLLKIFSKTQKYELHYHQDLQELKKFELYEKLRTMFLIFIKFNVYDTLRRWYLKKYTLLKGWYLYKSSEYIQTILTSKHDEKVGSFQRDKISINL